MIWRRWSAIGDPSLRKETGSERYPSWRQRRAPANPRDSTTRTRGVQASPTHLWFSAAASSSFGRSPKTSFPLPPWSWPLFGDRFQPFSKAYGNIKKMLGCFWHFGTTELHFIFPIKTRHVIRSLVRKKNIEINQIIDLRVKRINLFIFYFQK